jgi:CDP-glycerol glycerophosphotransferase
MRYEVYAFWRSRPIDKNLVMYESFAGNGMLCNPEAIFRALHSNPEFARLRHVWVLRSRRENPATVREFAGDNRVHFVRPRSMRYYRALATGGYLVNNATFPPEFGKRIGQTYLNTWHGTPLKKMGYDIGDPASRVGNVIRNFLLADYLLAANHFMTEQMYEKAHLLRHLYRGQIIEEGYPRIDHQFMDTREIEAARENLERQGIPVGGRKIILYAPTWKGTSFNRPEDDADELIRRVIELEAGIDTDRYVVLLKTHQVVHRFASHRPELRARLVPNEIPTNTVLGLAETLVTDYSSIFFDFLATGRPIVFLTPDIDDYAGYRGLYIEPDQWPGPVVRTVAELATELMAIDHVGRSPQVDENYRAMRERFSSHEDGRATERIVDIVFRGNREGYAISQVEQDERLSILINAGSMRANGITASVLNLLDTIDHDRFDVSVVFPTSYRKVVLGKQREINPRVRQFSRVGGMNGSKLTHLGRRRAWANGDLSGHSTDPAQRRMWDDEWSRCFGDSRFDYVVDFSGYGLFWATLMLHSPGSRRSIWLHNDLASDAHRITRGKRRQLRDLTGVFSLYREYDHLVSVSPALAAINRAELSGFADAGKFDSASNLVNAARVRSNASADLRQTTEDPETGALPDWVLELEQKPGITTFVSVGRLSPEKNHARLVRAFAIVHASNPGTRLLIVGDGVLRESLDALIGSLGLSGSVWITGHLPNPHVVMARADCFVLSSNYEGQPMVILEALVLGLPVVTVAFGSARDALPAGEGLVVPSTDEDLAQGMAAYLSGTVVSAPFDVTEYNTRQLDHFYRAIGVPSGTEQKKAPDVRHRE